MRILPSGSTALLVELDDLDQVLAMHASLEDDRRPPGVVDVVPAARTVLVVFDPRITSLAAVEDAVRRSAGGSDRPPQGDLLQVPVTYHGEDLAETAELLGYDVPELLRRHTALVWTVAFCGFSPGFGYLVSPGWDVDVPRRASPRTRVPPGSVALAGRFSGVYPQASPGGWQLLGRTTLEVFDLSREPAALLQPGTRVRFVDTADR